MKIRRNSDPPLSVPKLAGAPGILYSGHYRVLNYFSSSDRVRRSLQPWRWWRWLFPVGSLVIQVQPTPIRTPFHPRGHSTSDTARPRRFTNFFSPDSGEFDFESLCIFGWTSATFAPILRGWYLRDRSCGYGTLKSVNCQQFVIMFVMEMKWLKRILGNYALYDFSGGFRKVQGK